MVRAYRKFVQLLGCGLRKVVIVAGCSGDRRLRIEARQRHAQFGRRSAQDRDCAGTGPVQVRGRNDVRSIEVRARVGIDDVRDAAEIVLARRRDSSLRRRRHRGQRDRLHVRLQPFVVDEEEGLVLLDRPSEGSAVLVVVIRRSCSYGREVVQGVETLVPVELEQIAVELVGPGLTDDHDLPARHAPVFGRINAGKNLELLDRLDAWAVARPVDCLIVVVHPVQREVIPDFLRPGNVEAATVSQRRVLRGLKDPGSQQRKRVETPRNERQLLDVPIVDHRSDRR